MCVRTGKRPFVRWSAAPQLAFHELAALYAITDVALVTSLRDGMNLVSYEYVACQSDNAGALPVLQPSTDAGAKPKIFLHALIRIDFLNILSLNVVLI